MSATARPRFASCRRAGRASPRNGQRRSATTEHKQHQEEAAEPQQRLVRNDETAGNERHSPLPLLVFEHPVGQCALLGKRVRQRLQGVEHGAQVGAVVDIGQRREGMPLAMAIQ